MDKQALAEFEAASSVRRIAFDEAQIITGIAPGTYFVVVGGEAPCLNMKVWLSPLIYAACPEYWGIEVVGSVAAGLCLPTVKPYVVTIPSAGITGSKGIEVIGANRSQKFPLEGGCCP